MTAHDINLVQKSWATVATIDMETVGGLFYNRLFEIAPEVKPMFSRSSMAEQSRKLLSMLSYVMAKLDKLDDILDEVAKLAKRHVHYGVKESHYAAVGAALLWTLEKGLGELWNEELKAAWIKTYTVLSGAMIEVQNETLVA
ncbi:MAG: globin family protein [Bacteroidota bacterium]